MTGSTLEAVATVSRVALGEAASSDISIIFLFAISDRRRFKASRPSVLTSSLSPAYRPDLATPSSMLLCGSRSVLLLRRIGPQACYGMSKYRTLANKDNTIVCYHPPVPVPLSETRPLRPHGKGMAEQNHFLSPEQSEMVKKLRNDDPFVWTVGTLAKLFNVSKLAIVNASDLSEEKKERLKRAEGKFMKLHRYAKKKVLEKTEKERKAKLKKALENIDYDFPGQLDG